MSKPSFLPFEAKDLGNVVQEFNQFLSKLMVILRNINFEDNFKTYKWIGTIPANTTKRIPHSLNKIPKGKIIVKHVGGFVDDSTDTWTSSLVYLRNTDASNDAEITVHFYL